ncbi:hypothetical protein CCP3SC15_130019 [Gammaproteobacteria bacterium]
MIRLILILGDEKWAQIKGLLPGKPTDRRELGAQSMTASHLADLPTTLLKWPLG